MTLLDLLYQWFANRVAGHFQRKANRHQRNLEGVSSEEIDRQEQNFKELGRQRIHSRDVEMSHMQFVRLYHEREALLTAQRKAKKWKKRAEEAAKMTRRRRTA